jgi:O-antigen/teichoic acid export membrane protein
MANGEENPGATLREKVWSGGLALTVRSVAGFLVAALGNIILVRILALRDYGIYAIAAFWLLFLNGVLESGINTYIIKSRDDQLTEEELAAAFTLLHVVFVLICLALWILAAIIGRWFKEPMLYYLIILMGLPLYFSVWSRIPMALLEREMDYKKVGIIEWSSQCLYYVPAVVAAWAGLGVFSLVVGEVSKALSQAALALAFKKVPLRWSANRARLWKMAKFGLAFKGANLIWDINGAAAPLLVGKLVNLEALGIIRVAQGILNQLSLFQGIIWRVAIPALAQLQQDKERLARAVTQASYSQIILVGFPILLVAGQSYWLIPWVYGAKWQAVPLVILISALAPVAHAVFFMQMAPFFAAGKAFPITIFNLAYTITLWLFSFLLVSRFGYLGFCAAGYFLCLVHLISYYFFQKHIAAFPFFSLLALVIFLYLASVLSYFISNPAISLLVLLMVMWITLFLHPQLKAWVQTILRGGRINVVLKET